MTTHIRAGLIGLFCCLVAAAVGAEEPRSTPPLSLGPLTTQPFLQGTYTAGDNSAAFIAYLNNGKVHMIIEHQDMGDYGRGWTVHIYDDDKLVRFQRWSRLLSQHGAGSDGWYEQTFDLSFGNDRYLDGTKTVNGRVTEPDEHEIRGAYATGKAMLERANALR